MKKKTPQLNLSNPAFRTLDFRPEVGAIYFLFWNNTLQYIGRSNTVLQRVRAHRPYKHFDTVYYIMVSRALLDVYEDAFINYFRPPKNKTKFSHLREMGKSLIAPYVLEDLNGSEKDCIASNAARE